MISISALGPENTFSERAAQLYAQGLPQEATLQLYPSIRKAFSAVGNECSMGVLPIENMVEGYIQQVLDMLLARPELVIIDELLLPVRFSFVANLQSMDTLQKVYAQFAAQGQCSDFLDRLQHGVQIITTESNGTSLQQVLRGIPDEGAIIPSRTLDKYSFPHVIEGVDDYKNNQTRFIVIAKTPSPRPAAQAYKTSIVIVEGVDRPGMLSDILNAFAKRKINLVSIISRPTKSSLGKYHFFVDVEGHADTPEIREAFVEIRRNNEVRLLGTYPRALAPLQE